MSSLEQYSDWYDNLRKATLMNPLTQHNQQKKLQNHLIEAKTPLKGNTYQKIFENRRNGNLADQSIEDTSSEDFTDSSKFHFIIF